MPISKVENMIYLIFHQSAHSKKIGLLICDTMHLDNHSDCRGSALHVCTDILILPKPDRFIDDRLSFNITFLLLIHCVSMCSTGSAKFLENL